MLLCMYRQWLIFRRIAVAAIFGMLVSGPIVWYLIASGCSNEVKSSSAKASSSINLSKQWLNSNN